MAGTLDGKLIDAIYANKPKEVVALLKQGADPNARDDVTQPAVSAAAYWAAPRWWPR